MKRMLLLGLACLTAAAGLAWGKTSNGNDMALEYTEARDDAERRSIREDVIGRPHYFRYLRVIAMEKGETDGRRYVKIRAIEPSSYMNVRFTVTKPVSLQKLDDDPPTIEGDGIAVTGKIKELDLGAKLIVLHPVIVRHKDRLTPKIGQELHGELHPTSIYYTFTAVKGKKVSVQYRDRDLLEGKNAFIEKNGKEAWADHLQREVSKRTAARARD